MKKSPIIGIRPLFYAQWIFVAKDAAACVESRKATSPSLEIATVRSQAMTTPEQIAAKSEAELLAEFRSLFNWDGPARLTAKQWAKDHGFSQAYVSDVLHGRRGVADRFAEALGYRRVVTFEPLATLLEKEVGK